MDHRGPTSWDVARLAGVSRSTVSLVLNRAQVQIPESTRQRVLEAANKLGYHPNALARGLVNQHTNSVGVLVRDIANPVAALLVQAVEDAAYRAGFAVLLGDTRDSPDREQRWVDSLLERQVDGLICFLGRAATRLPQAALNRIPMVWVDDVRPFGSAKPTLPTLPMTDLVLTNNWLGGYLATRHLISLGHRTIGCFMSSTDPDDSAGLRYRGYLHALRHYHLPVHPGLIHVSNPLDAWNAVLRFFESNQFPRPTAIVTASDAAVALLAQALDRLELRIPQDVSVVGYDDTLGQRLLPPATSVSPNMSRIGELAFTLLRSRLSNPSLPPRRVVVNPSLVPRQSTIHWPDPPGTSRRTVAFHGTERG